MDVSFTKNVDLWVFCANFRVERDTWWNFAKVTSAKMPLFSQFLDFGKKRDFTFTFQLKIKPIDTTAAGDTLCGGLAAMLSDGYDLETSAVFGSKAATITCLKMGAQPSIPTKDEVLNFK